jgi:hypothetical protein
MHGLTATPARFSVSRNVLLVILAFAATYAAGFFLRIYVVDTPVSGEGGSAALMALRQGVLFGQLHSLWGGASLAAGLFALFFRGRASMYPWAVLTALALTNYNGDLGVVGLALGLVRLPRL